MAKTFHRMELKEVVISGYKSIAAGSPVHLNLSNINVLLGANGAGKSNILSFFNMVGAMMLGNFRYYVVKSGSISGFMYCGAKRTPAISASFTIKWKSTQSDEYVFSQHQLSDGSLRYIALATLLMQPKETIPGIIMIDEPELGLHPYAIDRFVEMMKDASTRTQIILSTQSPALIDGVDIDDIIVVDWDEATESTVARHLDKEDLSEWLEDYSTSELWNKNVIGGRPL